MSVGWKHGRIVFATGFETPGGMNEYLVGDSGGLDPSIDTTNVRTGANNLKFTKAGGAAASSNNYRYASYTGSSCVSTTFSLYLHATEIMDTNGHGCAILGYSLDGEGVGLYRDSGTQRIAMFELAGSVAWYSTAALTPAVHYVVTYTLRAGGGVGNATRRQLGMVILRDTDGVEIERSPWTNVGVASISTSAFSQLAIGQVAVTSGWTEAFTYWMDDIITVTGGCHAPANFRVYYVRPTGEGVLSRVNTGLCETGTTATVILDATHTGGTAFATKDVETYCYVPSVAAPKNARVASRTGTGQLNLAGAGLGGVPAVGAAYYLYGMGGDTDDDAVLWDEVIEVTPDTTTTMLVNDGTTASGNKFVGFVHGTLAGAGGPSSLAADEGLILNLVGQMYVNTGKTAALQLWDASTISAGAIVAGTTVQAGVTFIGAAAWASSSFITSWQTHKLRPLSAGVPLGAWDIASVNATEIGGGTTSSSPVGKLSWLAMEIGHFKENGDSCMGGSTMQEPGVVEAAQITGISAANPAVVTTEYNHGLATNDVVFISGSDSGVTIDGSRVVTKILDTTFSVPVNNTGAVGTKGQVRLGHYNVTGITLDNPSKVTLSGRLGTSPCEMGTATSGASTTLTDTAKTWTVDQWKYGEVIIISGTGFGQRRTVTTNSATALTVAAWSVYPSTDSVYILGNPIETASLAFTNSTPKINGEQYLVRQDSGTASNAGSSATSLDDSGRTWATNCWVDGYVYIVSGSGSGQVRKVTANDEDTLTAAFSPNVDNTSVYRVTCAPNVFISPTNVTTAGTAGKAYMRKPHNDESGG